jgi:hypothetical protein
MLPADQQTWKLVVNHDFVTADVANSTNILVRVKGEIGVSSFFP